MTVRTLTGSVTLAFASNRLDGPPLTTAHHLSGVCIELPAQEGTMPNYLFSARSNKETYINPADLLSKCALIVPTGHVVTNNSKSLVVFYNPGASQELLANALMLLRHRVADILEDRNSKYRWDPQRHLLTDNKGEPLTGHETPWYRDSAIEMAKLMPLLARQSATPESLNI